MTKDELIHEVHKIIWSDRGGNEFHPISFKDDVEIDSYGYLYLAEQIVNFLLDNQNQVS
jgi:hypothetical protein